MENLWNFCKLLTTRTRQCFERSFTNVTLNHNVQKESLCPQALLIARDKSHQGLVWVIELPAVSYFGGCMCQTGCCTT